MKYQYIITQWSSVYAMIEKAPLKGKGWEPLFKSLAQRHLRGVAVEGGSCIIIQPGNSNLQPFSPEPASLNLKATTTTQQSITSSQK